MPRRQKGGQVKVPPKVPPRPTFQGRDNRPPRSKKKAPQAKTLNVAGAKTDVVLTKTDARVATTTDSQLALATQLSTIIVDKPIPSNALYWVAVGYTTRALERGYLASATSIYYPYYALTYMTNLMISYAQVKAPPVVSMPYWLLCLCQALAPKEVVCGHGLVSYKLSVTGAIPFVPTVNTTIGFSPYGFSWTVGWGGGVPVNLFPTISVAGSAYTDDLGATAFQEMCQFMANVRGKKVSGPSRIVPSTIQTPFKNEVSSFALFKLAEGVGASGMGGGLYGQLQLEVPILHPFLALATSADDTAFGQIGSRNYTWAMPIAGDPVALGSFMSTILTTGNLSAKRNLRFKPVDFNEFGDVLAQWVQKVVQANLADQGTNLTASYASAALCPLTLQEVLILLRNTLMGAFKNSQSACQGIYPFKPLGNTDNQFVPFVASSATCFLAPLDMQLPRPFVENIRALVMRKLKYPASENDILWYIPVLGKMALDDLNSNDYQVEYTVGSDPPVTANVFLNGAIFEKVEIDSKGNEVRLPMVEAAIDLIDGASGTSIVFLNDPNRLKTLVAQWNSWIKGSGFESFSVPTITLSTELGINALCSISMSRSWIPAGQGSIHSRELHVLEKKNSSRELPRLQPKLIDKRDNLLRNKALVGTPYALRQAICDVSQGEILDAPYNQVLQTWILPAFQDEFVVSGNSILLQRWQFMMDESHLISRTNQSTGTTLSALHAAYAAKMTKAKLSQKDDWSLFFDQMAALGRGGILSGIVASLVGQAFPPAKGIAASVANVLPI